MSIRSALIMSLLVSSTLWAGDVTQAHPHRGVLRAYSAPPPLRLSADEANRVAAGEDVIRPFGGGDARPAIVFRVKAPPERVWRVVSDFKALSRYIDEVKRVEILRRDGEHTIAKLEMGQMGISMEEFVDYRFRDAERWGTWTLDYSKRSDLDDSVGFWRVTPGEHDGESIVEYSAEVRAMPWAPGFVQEIINDKAMRSTPGWVRRYSET